MSKRVIEAQSRVEAAREALIDTARELQQRLQPKTLVRDAWENAKVKGADLAEDAVDAVKSRPVATGGILAALTLFLAREPIRDGVRNIYDAMTSGKEGNSPPGPAKARSRSRKPAAKTSSSAPRPGRKTESKP